MGDDPSVDGGLERALRFARTNPNAVVLSLWPSALGPNDDDAAQADVARAWLRHSGATVLHEASVAVPESAAALLVLALYWGEDWLRTNCWYAEQPLEGLGVPGLARPTGAWPGAQWKKELCFRPASAGEGAAPRRLRVLVADVGEGDGGWRLWSEKYAVRAAMARETGRAGNSCLHLTDDQSTIIAGSGALPGGGGAGTGCNASYAFACARCLLNPESLHFLNRCAARFVTDDDLRSEEFARTFDAFGRWLGDRTFEDVVALPSLAEGDAEGDAEGNAERNSDRRGTATVKGWNRPPIWWHARLPTRNAR